MDVHNRDITEWLSKTSINTVSEFDWQAQLRYYWDNNGGVLANGQARNHTVQDDQRHDPVRLRIYGELWAIGYYTPSQIGVIAHSWARFTSTSAARRRARRARARRRRRKIRKSHRDSMRRDEL